MDSRKFRWSGQDRLTIEWPGGFLPAHLGSNPTAARTRDIPPARAGEGCPADATRASNGGGPAPGEIE